MKLKIMKAAYREWTRHGYFQGQLNVVCEALDCPKSSLMHHIESRQNLLEQTLNYYPVSVFSLKMFVEGIKGVKFFNKSLSFKNFLGDNRLMKLAIHQLFYELPGKTNSWKEKDDEVYQLFKKRRGRIE